MSTPEPDDFEVSRKDVIRHAISLTMAADLLNSASAFLRSEDGSEEEAITSKSLNDRVDGIVGIGVEACAEVMMTLTMLILNTIEPDAAQEWFTDQADHVDSLLRKAAGG